MIGPLAGHQDRLSISGPTYWHLSYPACAGAHQSPIDISTSRVEYSPDLVPLHFSGYDSPEHVDLVLKNDGHAVEVDVTGNLTISHGGLPGTYQLEKYHFHWGKTFEDGSDHHVNGHAHPMELHILHYETGFDSFMSAAPIKNAIAVLSIPIDEGAHNDALQHVVDHLDEIRHKGSTVHLDAFALDAFLPSSTDAYYRYDGSMTIPPCYESVIWTVFKESLTASKEQIEAFRSKLFANVEGEHDDHMYVSHRPTMPSDGRHVYTSEPTPGNMKVYYATDCTCNHAHEIWPVNRDESTLHIGGVIVNYN